MSYKDLADFEDPLVQASKQIGAEFIQYASLQRYPRPHAPDRKGLTPVCGIAGILHQERRATDKDALRRMTRALTHRGPDEEGYHEEPGIGLGHRRLSIIDLSTGQQPLCNEDGSIWVTFNGEIFNYVELREDLELRGHQFKTRSDTETLVHLYEEKGLDLVDHLNGQFAFAIWDRNRRRLVLARDRVGIRPLFYSTLGDGTVLFGSEMKALLAHGAIRAEIDPVAVGQVASLWVTVPPRTSFKNIQELGPGRILVFEEGRRSERRYWQHRFPKEHEYEERSFEYWSGEVRQLMQDAVRLQLRSDVPVATYLSGGLDSSIISALVKRYHINDLVTFSVSFSDGAFDEREFQQQMVRHLETDHRVIEVGSDDIGSAFSDVVWYAERPMMRTAPGPLLRLAGLVREKGIKVVLTGEGADEIFGGYNIFREDKVRRFWARNPESRWRSLLLSRLYGYIKRDLKAEAFWRLFFRPGLENLDDRYYSHRIRWNNSAQMKRLFAPDYRAQFQNQEALMAEVDAYLDPSWADWHPMCRAQYLEMTLFMSCYLLNSQGDRMMMAHSVEGRVPFLDHRLIELAAAIPPKFKMRSLEEKFVLKRTFADLIPPSIANRPKKPFRAPIANCFMPGQKNLGAELLTKEELNKTGFANADAFGKLIEKAAAAGGVLSERDEMVVATMASLQLLNHHFVARGHPSRSQEDASA
jgi:asparagine synthase (glutamine-hydrolysing)